MSAEPIFLNSTAYTDYERRLQKLTETALFSRNLLNAKQHGTPAPFYPFFSMGKLGEHCYWGEGNDIPGFTQNDFGRNNQYGTILARTHTNFGGGGTTRALFIDFRQILSSNPCLAPGASGGR